MTGLAGRILAMIAAVGLAGCSTGILGGEDPGAEDEARAAVLASPLVPIQSVRSIELGRTRDGFIITAYGTAPGLGYATPRLRARRDGQPGRDGYIDYDFIARAPAAGLDLPPGTIRSREVRADLPVTLSELQGVAGIRIHALQGGIQMAF